MLLITHDDLTFTRDLYENEKLFRFEDFAKEFRAIWDIVNSILKVRNIRRIGYVVEHRFSIKEPSNHIFPKIIKLTKDGQIDNFVLTYESRTFAEGEKPDIEKANFVNEICSIYDSVKDVEHPEKGFLNVNIDVQRYFAPAYNGKVSDELLKLYNKDFVPANKTYFEQLKKLGALDGEAK